MDYDGGRFSMVNLKEGLFIGRAAIHNIQRINVLEHTREPILNLGVGQGVMSGRHMFGFDVIPGSDSKGSAGSATFSINPDKITTTDGDKLSLNPGIIMGVLGIPINSSIKWPVETGGGNGSITAKDTLSAGGGSDASNVVPGQILHIRKGDNEGWYQIKEVIANSGPMQIKIDTEWNEFPSYPATNQEWDIFKSLQDFAVNTVDGISSTPYQVPNQINAVRLFIERYEHSHLERTAEATFMSFSAVNQLATVRIEDSNFDCRYSLEPGMSIEIVYDYRTPTSNNGVYEIVEIVDEDNIKVSATSSAVIDTNVDLRFQVRGKFLNNPTDAYLNKYEGFKIIARNWLGGKPGDVGATPPQKVSWAHETVIADVHYNGTTLTIWNGEVQKDGNSLNPKESFTTLPGAFFSGNWRASNAKIDFYTNEVIFHGTVGFSQIDCPKYKTSATMDFFADTDDSGDTYLYRRYRKTDSVATAEKIEEIKWNSVASGQYYLWGYSPTNFGQMSSRFNFGSEYLSGNTLGLWNLKDWHATTNPTPYTELGFWGSWATAYTQKKFASVIGGKYNSVESDGTGYLKLGCLVSGGESLTYPL